MSLTLPTRRASASVDDGAHDAATDVLSAIAAGLAQAVSDADLPLPIGQERDVAPLLVTPQYEARLIAWALAGGLQLHDHGGSHGVVHVARGRLAETFVDPGPDAELRTRMLGAGSGVDIPAERIHEVWNPGPGPALNVHVYSPRLTSMTFFDRVEDSLVPSYTQHGDVVTLENGPNR